MIVPIGNGWSETVFFFFLPALGSRLLSMAPCCVSWQQLLLEAAPFEKDSVEVGVWWVHSGELHYASPGCRLQVFTLASAVVCSGCGSWCPPPLLCSHCSSYRTTFLLCSFKCHPFTAQLSSTSFLEFKNILLNSIIQSRISLSINLSPRVYLISLIVHMTNSWMYGPW